MESNNHVLQKYLNKFIIASMLYMPVLVSMHNGTHWLLEPISNHARDEQPVIIRSNDPSLLKKDIIVPQYQKIVFIGCTFQPHQEFVVKYAGYATLVQCSGVVNKIILEENSTLDMNCELPLQAVQGTIRGVNSTILFNGFKLGHE